MPDYRRMYLHVFNEMSRIIEIAQSAQCLAEEMYLIANESPVVMLENNADNEPADTPADKE